MSGIVNYNMWIEIDHQYSPEATRSSRILSGQLRLFDCLIAMRSYQCAGRTILTSDSLRLSIWPPYKNEEIADTNFFASSSQHLCFHSLTTSPSADLPTASRPTAELVRGTSEADQTLQHLQQDKTNRSPMLPALAAPPEPHRSLPLDSFLASQE